MFWYLIERQLNKSGLVFFAQVITKYVKLQLHETRMEKTSSCQRQIIAMELSLKINNCLFKLGVIQFLFRINLPN